MTTRYAKAGKTTKWTVRELQSIPASWTGDTLSEPGMQGEVRVGKDGDVSIKWRTSYRAPGETALRWAQLGTWPLHTLEHIRDERDKVKGHQRAKVNPVQAAQAERIEAQRKIEQTLAEEAQREAENQPFRSMYEAWLKDGVARKDGNKEIERAFKADVLPVIGEVPVRLITEDMLRKVLRKVIGREAPRMACRLFNDLTQCFAWAEERQPWRRLLIEGVPTKLIDIEKMLPRDYDMQNIRERILDSGELCELRDVFALMEDAFENAADRRKAERPVQKTTQLALWICLGTLSRIGELLMAEWEHVNFAERTWFVPRSNVKDNTQDHLVFLSDFALEQFRLLHEITGRSRWLFPSRDGMNHVSVKTVSKQVGDRQFAFKNRVVLKGRKSDNTLVLADGKNGEWTPHDLRRTGATMMQELGITPDMIDRCQNHVMKGGRVRRHYLKFEYAEEKKHAWTVLGQRLEIILGNSNVIQFQRIA